ncbi:MAG: cupin domain-containing protein, partial [Methyloceanibacter sp.]
QVRIDTGKMPYVQLRDRANVEMMPLFRDAHEDVRLERWAPGAAIFLPVPGGAEFLLLAGTFEEAGEQFVPQSWLRLPAGATLNAVAGAEGCVVWAKSGHLSQPSASPPS